MLRSGCPKFCRDDCFIKDAYVHSNTALYIIFSLKGQFTESRVKDEPYDVSPMAAYAWYECVKFCDTSVNSPYSNIQLGRDLGAPIDIGHVMARKA
jgi:hypothetical protein